MSTEEKLRTYILENYLFTNNESQLNNTDSFMKKGILDSTGIMELIFFIEGEFSIQIADEEMIPENLDSINNLISFIEKKLV